MEDEVGRKRRKMCVKSREVVKEAQCAMSLGMGGEEEGKKEQKRGAASVPFVVFGGSHRLGQRKRGSQHASTELEE